MEIVFNRYYNEKKGNEGSFCHHRCQDTIYLKKLPGQRSAILSYPLQQKTENRFNFVVYKTNDIKDRMREERKRERKREREREKQIYIYIPIHYVYKSEKKRLFYII